MLNQKEMDYLYCIHNYFKALEKTEMIAKYIFNHPEILEKKYMHEYPHEQFRFFGGKIGRLAREKGKLYELLTNDQKEELQRIEIYERN